MAQYTIDFSTNASAVIQELNRIIATVAKVEKVGDKAELNINTSSLSAGIRTTFRQLDREIAKAQRKLNKLEIGGGVFRKVQATLGFREGRRERGELIGQPLRLRGQAQSFEQGSLVRLEKELQALQIEASQISPNTQEWVQFQQQIGQVQRKLKKADQAAEAIQLRDSLGSFAPNSLNQLEAKLKLLRNRANDISPNTGEWKRLNREIQKLEGGIERINRKPLGAGQRLGAAGGAFLYGGGMGGGIGSALGGVAGGLIGGVPGAFTGAALGQVADTAGQAIARITTQASQIQQYQRGLALASIDARDFAKAQEAIIDTSKRLFIPLEQVARNFTQLRVNTKQYGLSVEETKRILEGTILAVSAVGGSAQDVDGAMRAVVQILSKGSVQAEELRGQLGERFPGAVVKFAQANKLSFEELQQGLQEGKIGIQEFITFAEKNYADYAEFSKTLATAPEFAGRRLQIALEQVGLALGGVFSDAGASIQDSLSDSLNTIANFINENKADLKTIADGFASLVTIVQQVGKAISDAIGDKALNAFRRFAEFAISVRNIAVGGDIQSVASERESVRKQLAAAEKEAVKYEGLNVGEGIVVAHAVRREAAGLSERLRQLDKQYRDLGGDAALKRMQPTSTYTYGGPGAGVDLAAKKEDDQQKKREQMLRAYERLEESILDARERREERLAQIREDAVERAKKLEQDLAEERKNLEREIEATRRRIAATEEDAAFDLQAFEAASRGEDPEITRVQQEITRAARARDEERIEREQRLMDEQAKRAKAIEDLKTSVAKAVNEANMRYAKAIGKAQLEYAKTIANIGNKSADYQAKRLKLAAEMAELLSYRSVLNLQRFLASGSVLPPRSLERDLDNMSETETTMDVIDRRTASIERELAAGPIAGGVSAPRFSGVNISDLERSVSEAVNVVNTLDSSLASLGNELASGKFAKEVQESILPRVQALNQLLSEQQGELAQQRSVRSFRAQGFRADEAQFLTQATMQYDSALNLLDKAYKTIGKEASPEELAKIEEAYRRIEAAIVGAQIKALEAGKTLLNPTFAEKLQDASLDVGDNLRQLTDKFTMAQTSVNAISDAIGTAFSGIVTGTATMRDALGDMFRDIANSFAEMASSILREAVKANLLGLLRNIFGPQGSPIGAPGLGSPVKSITSLIPMANGGIAAGGFRAFATGGIVKGPTMGLVGEGRYNEAVVPLPDGKSIPVDLGGASSNISTNIVVNVSNGQVQSEGNAGPSDLGRKLEGAVKQVIVGELRPGGLLAGRR
jgi:tape measure domain-containing protein